MSGNRLAEVRRRLERAERDDLTSPDVCRQLRHDAGWLLSEVEQGKQTKGPSAASKALDEIAHLCGCPEWDYPGQLVRDVQQVVDDRDEARAEVERLQAELSNALDSGARLATSLDKRCLALNRMAIQLGCADDEVELALGELLSKIKEVQR